METVNTVSTLFRMGRLVATPGALAALARSREGAGAVLARHGSGDWGDISAEDYAQNMLALRQDLRLMSVYKTRAGDTLWVITESDRSATTILLPEDY